MEGQFSYQDFDLLIERGPPGSYRARMLRSPAGECALVQFTPPFSKPELETSCSSSARAAAAPAGPVARKRAAERPRRPTVRRGIPRRAAGRIATQRHPDPRAAGGDAAAAGG